MVKLVATSKISSMPEVGGNAAYYFDPHSTEEIKNSIRYLLVSENRSNLESKISAQLQKFESKEILKQYQFVYSNLM